MRSRRSECPGSEWEAELASRLIRGAQVEPDGDYGRRMLPRIKPAAARQRPRISRATWMASLGTLAVAATVLVVALSAGLRGGMSGSGKVVDQTGYLQAQPTSALVSSGKGVSVADAEAKLGAKLRLPSDAGSVAGVAITSQDASDPGVVIGYSSGLVVIVRRPRNLRTQLEQAKLLESHIETINGTEFLMIDAGTATDGSLTVKLEKPQIRWNDGRFSYVMDDPNGSKTIADLRGLAASVK